uniref:Uncharacterized protein n=1 Tax=Arundo donax TaxID=35708 RepID=A0A0A9HP38_ARUDO
MGGKTAITRMLLIKGCFYTTSELNLAYTSPFKFRCSEDFLIAKGNFFVENPTNKNRLLFSNLGKK